MDKQRSAAGGAIHSSPRLEELIDELLASVRGGDGVDDPTVPGPVSCGNGSGKCVRSPCATPPCGNDRIIETPAPLCAVINNS